VKTTKKKPPDQKKRAGKYTYFQSKLDVLCSGLPIKGRINAVNGDSTPPNGKCALEGNKKLKGTQRSVHIKKLHFLLR